MQVARAGGCPLPAGRIAGEGPPLDRARRVAAHGTGGAKVDGMASDRSATSAHPRRARPWRLRQRGLDAAACRWPPGTGHRRPRHRPAQTQGRGRGARLSVRPRQSCRRWHRAIASSSVGTRTAVAWRRSWWLASTSRPGMLPPIAGLVCFSYPLHLPGRPEKGLRTEHWPAIAVPTLILEGESDPFARIELLRAAMPLLAQGRLVTWPAARPRARAGPRRGARHARGLARRGRPRVSSNSTCPRRLRRARRATLRGAPRRRAGRRPRVRPQARPDRARPHGGRAGLRGSGRRCRAGPLRARRRPRAAGCGVIASCPYVRSYLAKHPEDHDIVVGMGTGPSEPT